MNVKTCNILKQVQKKNLNTVTKTVRNAAKNVRTDAKWVATHEK